MTTLSELQKMNDVEAYFLAKKMASACFDKERLYRLAGGREDLIQMVALQLHLFKTRVEELAAGANLETACFGIVRGKLKASWMVSAFCDDTDAGDDDHHHYDIEEDENKFTSSLDDIKWLTALDKLLIRHDTLKNGSAHCQTKDLADLFGCETRTIRYRRGKLKARLIQEFNLAADFFDRKHEFAIKEQ